MDKMTQEEWEVLTEDEQALHQEEKPDEEGEKTSQPTNEELQGQIKELGDKLSSVEGEKKGLYGDLKSERELRQQLQGELGERKKSDTEDSPLKGREDEDYLTVGDIKKILSDNEKAAEKDKRRTSDEDDRQRSKSNFDADEQRMEEKEGLTVPYKEAIAEFDKIAKTNPGLWTAIDQEARRVGGKPAELAYSLALASPALLNKVKSGARDDLVKNLEKEGKVRPRKFPSGGSGEIPSDPNLLSEEDLMGMDDKQMDTLLKKTG